MRLHGMQARIRNLTSTRGFLEVVNTRQRRAHEEDHEKEESRDISGDFRL